MPGRFIPGNEQPGQGGQQQPAQGQQTGQQNPVRTTAPGQPQQTGQPTQSGQQPTSTVTVTQTQSQCPAPGAAGAPGAGGPGGGAPGGDGGTTGGPDSDSKDGAPSWAYLVAEATGVMAGRRRPGGGASASPSQGGDAAQEAERVSETAASAVDQGETAASNAARSGVDSVRESAGESGTSPEVALMSETSTLADGSTGDRSPADALAEISQTTIDNVGLSGDPLAIASSTAITAKEFSPRAAPVADAKAADLASRAADAAESAEGKSRVNPTKYTDKVDSWALSKASDAASKTGSALTKVASKAPVIGNVITAVQVGVDYNNGTDADKAIAKGLGSVAGGWGGALAGAQAGAALGSVVPGVGTAIGGAIGAAAGGVIGSGAGSAVVNWGYDGAKKAAGKIADGVGNVASKLKFW